MAFAIARFAEHGYHTTSVAEIVEGLDLAALQAVTAVPLIT